MQKVSGQSRYGAFRDFGSVRIIKLEDVLHALYALTVWLII